MTEKESEEDEYFMTYENYVKCKFQCPQIKLYYTTARYNHLYIVYGCSRAAAAKLSSCDKGRDCVPTKPKVFLTGPLQKRFADLCSKRFWRLAKSS